MASVSSRLQGEPGTTHSGGAFPTAMIEAVWNKARIDPHCRKLLVRLDAQNTPIERHSYGLLTERGWKIDYIVPVSDGGTDDIDNLQPLNWKNLRKPSEE